PIRTPSHKQSLIILINQPYLSNPAAAGISIRKPVQSYRPLPIPNPNPVLVIGDHDMLLKLMKYHFDRLGAVIEEALRSVPGITPRHFFLWLGFGNDAVVTIAAPEPFVVVCRTRFVGFAGLHLGFAEVLDGPIVEVGAEWDGWGFGTWGFEWFEAMW